MKKIIAIFMSLVLLLGCASCTSSKSSIPENVSEIFANFTKIDSDGNMVVYVQDLGGVYSELFDKDGIVLKFINGDDEVYDKDGNKMNASKLECGDSVKITYDGKVAKNNPKTIKVYKVEKTS